MTGHDLQQLFRISCLDGMASGSSWRDTFHSHARVTVKLYFVGGGETSHRERRELVHGLVTAGALTPKLTRVKCKGVSARRADSVVVPLEEAR